MHADQRAVDRLVTALSENQRLEGACHDDEVRQRAATVGVSDFGEKYHDYVSGEDLLLHWRDEKMLRQEKQDVLERLAQPRGADAGCGRRKKVGKKKSPKRKGPWMCVHVNFHCACLRVPVRGGGGCVLCGLWVQAFPLFRR